MLYLLWSNGGPPTKCLSWSEFRTQIASSSDQQFRRYCDVKMLAFWLETAYSRPFLGCFWVVFSPYDVTHRPDP